MARETQGTQGGGGSQPRVRGSERGESRGEPRPRGRTKVDELYVAIKDAICMGRLLPGERLSLNELCETHKVSLTVVREAVTRLASERLVQATPQHGFRVWPLSVPDLLDLTRVRVEIEILAVGESVAVGDVDWEADLVAAHHRLVAAARNPTDGPPRRPNYAWMKAHAAFHDAVAAACTSPLLKQLRRQLFDAAELYRYWSATLKPTRAREVAKEHRAVLDAALAHNPDDAVRLLTDHIRHTTDLLIACHEDEDDTDASGSPPAE